MADVFMCEKLADSGKSMGGNVVALFCSGFMETYCPFHKVLHRFDRISKSFQSTTGGGPRIVGPRWISGENICTFPSVSFFAYGAQLELDTYSHSTLTSRTQPEKVIIFRYTHFSSLRGGSNRPIKRK